MEFDTHLEQCSQCRDHPLALCAEGADLLQRYGLHPYYMYCAFPRVDGLPVSNTVMLSINPRWPCWLQHVNTDVHRGLELLRLELAGGIWCALGGPWKGSFGIRRYPVRGTRFVRAGQEIALVAVNRGEAELLDLRAVVVVLAMVSHSWASCSS